MPIIWRYLLSQYFRVLLFCVVSFIGVLLTSRLDDIAKFAAMGPDTSFVARFALYQIPYILPIAIPVSCLISSSVLFQGLSDTHELTAMRSAGLALRDITAPILAAALLITLVNFYIISELATRSHLNSRQMEETLKSMNPLLLLQKRQLLKLKGVYAEVESSSQSESAADLIVVTKNKKTNRLNLVTMHDVHSGKSELSANTISTVTTLSTNEPNQFDHLLIENLDEMTMPHEGNPLNVRRRGWRISNDYLKMSLLLVRMRQIKAELKQVFDGTAPQSNQLKLERRLAKCYAEVARRVSAAVAAFSFTLMGLAFGIGISRHRSHKGTIAVVILAALYLTCFFVAKEIDEYWVTSTLLYTVPQILIIGLSINSLRKTSQGIEQ